MSIANLKKAAEEVGEGGQKERDKLFIGIRLDYTDERQKGIAQELLNIQGETDLSLAEISIELIEEGIKNLHNEMG